MEVMIILLVATVVEELGKPQPLVNQTEDIGSIERGTGTPWVLGQHLPHSAIFPMEEGTTSISSKLKIESSTELLWSILCIIQISCSGSCGTIHTSRWKCRLYIF